MSEELRNCTQQEVEGLRRIINQGFIDSDEEWELYKKFAGIKAKLREEGVI